MQPRSGVLPAPPRSACSWLPLEATRCPWVSAKREAVFERSADAEPSLDLGEARCREFGACREAAIGSRARAKATRRASIFLLVSAAPGKGNASIVENGGSAGPRPNSDERPFLHSLEQCTFSRAGPAHYFADTCQRLIYRRRLAAVFLKI